MRSRIAFEYDRQEADLPVKGGIGMAEMMNCKEAAEKWNFTERWVSILCKQGRIEGAVMVGHRWLLPVDTPRPADTRVRTGAYKKETASVSSPKVRPLPQGITDFRRLCSDYYYVDKTSMIKDFLDRKAQVSLFLRPRRFGKTVNLDMFRTFFENTSEDTSSCFTGRNIWKAGDVYRREQGKYPVIFLTFKDVRFDSFEKALQKIRTLVQKEFDRHSELLVSDRCTSYQKELYRNMVLNTANEVDLSSSLSFLCDLLTSHYGIAPVVIIDDYDVPFVESQRHGYAEEMGSFLRNFYSAGLKDNRRLTYGILAGTVHLPDESMILDSSAVRCYDVTTHDFSQSFGFTTDELQKLAEYYHMADRAEAMDEWYGGYHIGNAVLVNPWSAVACLANNGRLKAYDVNAGDLHILELLFRSGAYGSIRHLRSFLQDRYVKTQVSLQMRDVFDPDSLADIYGLMVNNGFLTVMMQKAQPSGIYMYDAMMPNMNVITACKKEFLQYLTGNGILPKAPAATLQEALYNRDALYFQQSLKQLIYQSVRDNSSSTQDFYQALITGLIVLTEEYYVITDVQDVSGDNYDIQLIPNTESLPGVKIEIKAGKTVKLFYTK